jgi:hypothetical protein
MQMTKSIAIFALLRGLAVASIRIQDTVKYPDGTPAARRAEVTLFTPFFTPGNEPIGTGKQTVTITNGAIDTTLEPNDIATPAGTSYAVRFYLTRGTFDSSPSGFVVKFPGADPSPGSRVSRAVWGRMGADEGPSGITGRSSRFVTVHQVGAEKETGTLLAARSVRVPWPPAPRR